MTHDAENWDVLQSLFHLAEENPSADLDSLLQKACPDTELRSRARALILSARASEANASVPVPEPQESEPRLRRVGPYSIVRLLGSGGIGTVYLVERIAGGVVQRAALKVLSLHAAGPFFADRFAREQHILASLEHPHITRMLDVGQSEGGEPYLVMEYVDGIHLDTFCDDHALGVPARLRLFLQACEAVAYAHRNLVVHLDLKPSNILVTETEGNVKLLDFGTSKLIQPDSLLTTTVMATPAYASPEQLRNEAVTTACDVYALGAILFELLSGRRPNQDSSVAIMIERSIKELPPEPITGAVTPEAAAHRGLTQTRLLNLLRGDLATIVAKCLSPRPKDRYASVDALSTDIQRYLGGRPILARPQTTTYRLTKFVRRNRKSVIAGIFAILMIVTTSTYALWRQHQALLAAQRALQMQTFMYRLFKLANSNYMGKPTATVTEFLELGVKVLPDFIKDPTDLRAAQLSLAESLFDNGDISHAQEVFLKVIQSAKSDGDFGAEAEAEGFEGNIDYTQGKTEEGEALAKHALAISHYRGVSAAARVWIEVFAAANHQNTGFFPKEDIALMQSAVDESRKSHLPERETAFALTSLAEYLGLTGHIDEGEPYLRQAIAIYDREPYAFCDRSGTYVDLGYVSAARGDVPKSLEWFRKAYDGYRLCLGESNERTLIAQQYMAGAMLHLGKADAVVPMLEASVPLWRKLFNNTPELYYGLTQLGRAYIAQGQYLKAEGIARELIGIQAGKVSPHGARAADTQLLLARALFGEGRFHEALPFARIAETNYGSASAPSPADRQHGLEAHQLSLDIQAKLSGSVGKPAHAPHRAEK